MSGAAEGLAGLTLSAISVAALFTTCIECFDIVIAGKNFSEDFEQLCALFSLERARFGLWGESVGLIPDPNNGRRLQYDKNIDRQDIRPGVERILNNIQILLEEGARINKKYGEMLVTQQSTSLGMQVFKTSFERFKLRIREHQKDTPAWKVTSWVVHDAKKFEDLIERLRRYVDGLESITKSLGLLENQHSRLLEEIDSISDVESLRLLRDASSIHGNSSTGDISETASKRMVMIVESLNSEGFSFKTACTRQSTGLFSHPNSMPKPPGAWPPSLPSHKKEMGKETQQKRSNTCQECLQEHYKCETINKTGSCLRCIQTGRECSFSKSPRKDLATSFTSTSEVVDAMYDANTDPSSPQQLSQNRRLMQGLIEMAGPQQALSFSTGDTNYGDRLTAIKSEDAEFWVQSSGKLVTAAQTGPAVWKRIFLDLRGIRQANIPFISATPINNSLDTILASIEGPPETPYEGGIFWITFKITDHYPDQLPLMRFNTKIYHPNISPQGYVCCIDSQLQNHPRRLKSLDKWPSGSNRKLDWSIGALLTALCDLLSSPDVDDPLVPEIAHTYHKNFDEYCSNARLYTKKYASGERPDETNIVFFDISSQGIDTSSKDVDSSSKEIDLTDSLNSHQRKHHGRMAKLLWSRRNYQ